VRDRAPTEVFVWEEKPPKSAALLTKKKWTKPARRWFTSDQGDLGKNIPDFEPADDINLYNTDIVQGLKSPYHAFRLFELLTTHGNYRERTEPMTRLSGPSKDSIRADGRNHWIILTEITGKCKHCEKRSLFRYI
jgi:hypothetical protein